MNRISKSLMLFISFLYCSSAFAQVHTVTYEKKYRAIDTVLNFANEPHTIVKLPVRDYGTGNRFAVIFPTSSFAGFVTAFTVATHNTDAFVPNMTIDSYPAQVQLSDSVTNSLQSDGLGGYNFNVLSIVSLNIAIDLGDTILSLSTSLPGLEVLTDVSIGTSANAVPFAEWGKYGDRNFIIAELDRWIDYVRIEPL